MIRIRSILSLVIASTVPLCACNRGADGDGNGDFGTDEPGQTASGTATTDPRCLPDGGYVDNECDGCENASCCATRFGCYDDASCSAANDAFDACMTAAEGDAGSAAAVKQCWDSFANSSSVAKARVDCQRAHCAVECGVPSP